MSSDILSHSLRAWSSDRIVRDYVSHAGLSPDEVFSIGEAWASVRGQLLDIGVGAGRTVPFLSAFAGDYTAIDYAEGMVAACRRKYPDIQVERGDARQLDFAADSFSFVMFSFNGIDYVHPDDRAKVIKEIHRVLKPGGHFAFSSHNLHATSCTQSHGFRIRWPAKTKNPIRFAVRLLRTARENLFAFKNHKRLHALEFVKESIAFINDGSHDFAYVTCYIDYRKQAQDLRDAGFEDVTIVGRNGRPISSNPGDEWLSYLVRKPYVVAEHTSDKERET